MSYPNKGNIMGGMFGLEKLTYNDQPQAHFFQEPCLKLFNARSGINVLCQLLRPAKVWLPSYLCNSMVDAVPKNVAIGFYAIDMALRVAELGWISGIKRGDLVLFIDYFGFDLHSEAMQEVRERKAWILQDAAQALLSTFTRPHADFILFSPKKTVGVPDGGILQSQCSEDFCSVKLKTAPAYAVQAVYDAFWMRTNFDYTGAGDWFNQYKTAEKMTPIGNFQMSRLSEALLRSGFDYIQIAQQRKANYRYLLEEVPNKGLFPFLPDTVTPLGFPIFCVNREQLQARLYAENIFCPVHWPLASAVPQAFKHSYKLSKKLLTLLCDHRYSVSLLNKITTIVNRE
jgi:dTDP-4-amino-4,6-dideoxygalactose transaminase